jgi:hypothetical protein
MISTHSLGTKSSDFVFSQIFVDCSLMRERPRIRCEFLGNMCLQPNQSRISLRRNHVFDV